jgi:anti-sigma B factor antagonist
MEFTVSSATIEGTGLLLVAVEGELDIATAARLEEPAEVAVSVGCPLVLDLSECSFIDSTGLRAVLHTHRVLLEVGEPMALVSDGSQVRRMLSVTGIDLSVRIFATRDEAFAWLGTGGARVSEQAPALSLAR